MDAKAPITQDVLTLPRKLPEGPQNLIGLSREQMRAALIAAGTPEKQAKMRVGQIWQWIYEKGVRDFALMTNLAKGYRAELESMIAARGLNEVVRLVDHCDDMPAAYMLTDVVISASTDPEAFGRVIAEAQALGRPVIATDHGGAKETVIPGVTGWLVPPGDADALAAAIEKVLSLDSAQRSTLAGKAIANVRDNFSKATMCAKTLDVYDEVLGVRPPV